MWAQRSRSTSGGTASRKDASSPAPQRGRTDRQVDVISGYAGTQRLFEAAGFEVAGPTTRRSGGHPRVIMRREPRIP